MNWILQLSVAGRTTTERIRVDPRTYCERAIGQLRRETATQHRDVEGRQRVVVLAYFAQQQPSARDFASQLRLLAESAERSRRTALAAAARAVLRDWEARAAGPEAAAAPA
jgi:hypothetical protein